jgi:membrane protein DedA with SNARE-associated domain
VDLWDRLAELMLRLIDEHDDLAIFLWLFIEETGFPLPLPGDLAMLLAGYRVAQGAMNPIWALFLLEAATLLGGSALYWLGARGGRPLLLRYGRYVRLDRAKLERTEAWLQRRPILAITIGRMTPGLRNITVLAAGVFAVPYRTFLPGFALGSFVYIAFFFGLGMWAGPQALETIGAVRVSIRLIVTTILFVGLGTFLTVMYRRAALVRHLAREPAPEMRKIETSVMAGLLATLLMGMGLNVLLYVFAAVGVGPPEQALLRFFEQGAGRLADGNMVRFGILVVAIVFVSELVWSVVYTHLPSPFLRIAPWLRGLAFSVLPLSFSALVLLPALGAGPLGLHLEAGLVPFAGEALRNVLYAVGLATSYSLLRVARQRPARAAMEQDAAATRESEPTAGRPDSSDSDEGHGREDAAPLGGRAPLRG